MGGKQFKITEGQTVTLEKQVDLRVDVLAYFDGENLNLGTPTLNDLSIDMEVTENFRSRKLRVAKFRAKSRYRKVIGHRQHMSTVKFTNVGEKASKSAKSEKTAEAVEITKTAKKTEKVAKPVKAVKATKTAKSEKPVNAEKPAKTVKKETKKGKAK